MPFTFPQQHVAFPVAEGLRPCAVFGAGGRRVFCDGKRLLVTFGLALGGVFIEFYWPLTWAKSSHVAPAFFALTFV